MGENLRKQVLKVRYERLSFWTIWKESYPNTHDQLQKCLPYVAISLNRCPLRKNAAESQAHIFLICPFVWNFWTKILHTFGWAVILPRSKVSPFFHPHGLPLQNIRSVIVDAYIESFVDKDRSMEAFFNHVIFIALSWWLTTF